jgi:hypothetical protein
MSSGSRRLHDLKLQHTVNTKNSVILPLEAVGACTFENFPHIFHHFNGFRPDSPFSFGVIGF